MTLPGIHVAGLGAGALIDPDWSSVVLYAKMNGADASTTFTDESGSAHSITANGNAQIDTAQSPSGGGGSSGLFDGSGDYLSIADNADWDTGTGDFTAECYLRAASIGTSVLFGQNNSAGSDASVGPIGLRLESSGVLSMLGRFNGTNLHPAYGNSPQTSAISANTWYHAAVCRDGSTARIYLDGVQGGTQAISGAGNNASEPLSIGRAGSFNGLYFNGHLAHLRITKGVCRYPSGTTFTPPPLPLPTQ